MAGEFTQEQLKAFKAQIDAMPPEQKAKVRAGLEAELQQQGGGGKNLGERIGSRLVSGVRGGLQALPGILGFPSQKTGEDLGTFEKKERIKLQVASEFPSKGLFGGANITFGGEQPSEKLSIEDIKARFGVEDDEEAKFIANLLLGLKK